jgi:exosortase A-associated hydrolase 2
MRKAEKLFFGADTCASHLTARSSEAVRLIPPAEPFFFRSGRRNLFGLWQGTPASPRAALLYCHPFGEEKKSAHRAFVETAFCLSREGVATLRFDMTGCGDSDGDFSEARLSDWFEDIVAAWAYLNRRAPGVCHILLGLRVGASLAALACRRMAGVSALVLWQPMVNGKTEFSAELRRLLIQDMITSGKASVSHEGILASLERGEGQVELDGYPITAGLYRDICEIDLLRALPQLPAACALIQFLRPQRSLGILAKQGGIPSVSVDVPPVWQRTEFIPDRWTGELLAREAVLRWIEHG